MTDRRIVVEEPCEHGEQNPHPYPGKRISDLPYCPGGAREVVSVPSPEAIEAMAVELARQDGFRFDRYATKYQDGWRKRAEAAVNAFIKVQFGIEEEA